MLAMKMLLLIILPGSARCAETHSYTATLTRQTPCCKPATAMQGHAREPRRIPEPTVQERP